MTSRLSAADRAGLYEQLRDLLGDRVSDSSAVREHHAGDEGHHRSDPPDMVAFPATTAEVAALVRLCATADCPVVAWGAGTSLEGNALAVEGGLCLDFSRMNAILDVRPDDLTVTVEAGVRRGQLNAHLKDTGLFFPIDPGADATLGGMAATRASGTNAVRYGTMRANVLSCLVVLADGSVIRTARRAAKSSAGYDLTALMVGSEGTLGLITELTVRLHPWPEETRALVCDFDDAEGAIRAVILAIQLGLPVARIEFLDARMMAAINAFQATAYAERPTLFLEFHGSSAAVAAQSAQFEAICSEFAGETRARAHLPEDRSRLWKARHNALYATRALRPGHRAVITDVCVPVSRLADCVLETQADLEASPLTSTIAGHVGDGNFHAFILIDPAQATDLQEAERLHARMARRAIGMDGTCTGEHGIGLGKRALLVEELGGAVSTMGLIKSALDPRGILNPGKILPARLDAKS